MQHVEHEGPGRIVPVFRDFGIPTEVRHLYRGDEVPGDLEDVRVLVVLGGPMGVADVGGEKYPFLAKEVELLQRMVRVDRPVLGICLGAQLLAHAAGAKVYPNIKMGPPAGHGQPPVALDPVVPLPEVGWLPVTFPFPGGTEPIVMGMHDGAMMFHWHYDTFDLPKLPAPAHPAPPPSPPPPTGNALLSSSRLCRNQAFRFKNRLFGFQYHIETNQLGIESMLSGAREDIAKVLGVDGTKKIRDETSKYYSMYERLGNKILFEFCSVPESVLSRIRKNRRTCFEFCVTTLHPILTYLRAYSRRKHVRPWSLLAPVVVLLICLPLLAPLRHPLKSQMSDEEMSRWATVQALVEQQTFAIDNTQFSHTRQRVRVADVYYSDQPPTQGLLLSGPYWALYKMGIRFSNRPGLVEYLLTMIGVTIPVAAAAGMLYRMGRLFELKRPWRAGLAIAVVLGSGLVSYATVLNPYAPAAALILGAAAILVQVSLVRSPLRSGGFLTAAGFFAALAAVIDPAAVVFTILFIGVILVMRWRWSLRIGGILMYCIGMVPPVMLHLSLSLPITGDWRLGLNSVTTREPAALSPTHGVEPEDESLSGPPTFFQQTWWCTTRLVGAFFGTHGLITHFPALILGMMGVGSVMHRHWPSTTKMLAIATHRRCAHHHREVRVATGGMALGNVWSAVVRGVFAIGAFLDRRVVA